MGSRRKRSVGCESGCSGAVRATPPRRMVVQSEWQMPAVCVLARENANGGHACAADELTGAGSCLWLQAGARFLKVTHNLLYLCASRGRCSRFFIELFR